jgi:hypothetical protein
VSGYDWEDGRDTERAETVNARDEWDETVRHWETVRQDSLTHDAPARRTACPYCGRVDNHRQSCQLFPVHAERVADAGYEAHDPKGASVR